MVRSMMNFKPNQMMKSILLRELFQITKIMKLNTTFTSIKTIAAGHLNCSIVRVYNLIEINKYEGSEGTRMEIDGFLSNIFLEKLKRPDKEYKM